MVTRAVKARKKMPRGQKIAIGVAIPLLAVVSLFFFPNYGTIKYGFCKTFLELQETYPASLQIVEAYEDPSYNMVVINYKRIDPFGLVAMNELRCFFEDQEGGRVIMTKVDINGKKRVYPQESQDIVKRFNYGMQAIVAYPPDLVMPWLASYDIKSYR